MARIALEGLSDQILDAALEQFRRFGYAKSSMARIAQAAGVATGTLYLYYENKNDILKACARRFHDEHAEQSKDLLADEDMDAAEKLSRYVLQRHDKWLLEIGDEEGRPDFAAALVRAAPDINRRENELWAQTLQRILLQGQKTRRFHFDSPAAESRIFFQCLIGFFPLPGVRHPFQPSRQDLKKMILWFCEKWRPS
ncbi:MAG: TetR/AcrR family transcriptional regulator [Bdellovibrionaceae bacterium]|nr:TetR/AcrR family transcriptional regulator [Pseudobdellovibrionaceae bacterium]MBX3034043.1 TetR/AcrR family transcriptional regulator [Pseudobdellovibrionaceae bacterium]